MTNDAPSFGHVGPITLPLQIDDSTLYYTLNYYDFNGARWASAHYGTITGDQKPSLRIESACFFGHVFNSQQCDCGYQLQEAFRRIAERGDGVVIYAIDQDARGLGIKSHFKIYDYRQNENLDSDELFKRLHAPLDSRSYAPVKDILNFLNVTSITLMSNNVGRYEFLKKNGFDVIKDPLEAPMTPYNMATLMLEKEDMGYKFSFNTHRDWLRLIQSKVDGNSRLYAGSIVKDNDEVVFEWLGEQWDFAKHLLDNTDEFYQDQAEYIVYLTDLPKIEELDRFADFGCKFIVVPFNPIPKELQSHAMSMGVKIQDWERENKYQHPRPQWQRIAENNGVSTYQRGELRIAVNANGNISDKL